MYCTLRVEDLSLADERTLMPKVEIITNIEKPSTLETVQKVKKA